MSNDAELVRYIEAQSIDLDHDTELLLEWAADFRGLKIEWDQDGLSMSWKHGTMSVSGVDEAAARKAVGLFIGLWSYGIPVQIAHYCAIGYVKTFKTVRRIS